MNHPNLEVQAAIVRLCDALCSFERFTGRTSALILREKGGFVFRAASGKPLPITAVAVSDQDLIKAETNI